MSKLRDFQILAHTMQGLNQQQVADKVGCTQATVSRRLKKILAKYAAENKEKIEELRALSHLELLQMKKIIWDSIFDTQEDDEDGPKEVKITWLDRLIKIEERIAKLYGLDSPTKIAPVMPSGDEAWQSVSDYEFIRQIILQGKYELDVEETLGSVASDSNDDGSVAV